MSLIDDDLLASVSRELAANEPLRLDISGGRVHIDRQLPFLLLYRRPPDREDPGTDELLLGEAAYLLASGETDQEPPVGRLIETIVRTQMAEFGSSLVLELWASPVPRHQPEEMVFRIHAPSHGSPSAVLEEFENALLGVEVDELTPRVEVIYDDAWRPPGLSRLDLSSEGEVLQLGLEVPAIHFDPETGAAHPFELRELRQSLGRALKLTFYEFTHSCTTTRPAHFHELGRQAMTDVVLEVDRALADLSDDFDLLLHVTPVNAPEARASFIDGGLASPPEFLYRPRTVDPSMMKRRLFQVPIERIEDPTLAHIFHEKRDELDRQLSLVADRNTPRFLLGSRALYGDTDPALHRQALDLLGSIPPDPRGGDAEPGGVHLLAELASQELAAYHQEDPSLLSAVEVRDDIPGVMVSGGNLLIGRRASVPRSRVAPLIAHEVGTHVLTHHNGRQQPFRELYAGMAGYESLQEGLGVLSEYLVGGLSAGRLRQLAGRVVAVQSLIDGADFVGTFSQLTDEWGFAPPGAFEISMRVHRGGGFTKDAVYLKGLVQVLDYLAAGEPLERLFMGKVAHTHLGLIEELEWRGVLSAPRLLPRHLGEREVLERVRRCEAGLTVLDLLEESTE